MVREWLHGENEIKYEVNPASHSPEEAQEVGERAQGEGAVLAVGGAGRLGTRTTLE